MRLTPPRSSPPGRRVAAVGFQGFGNLGDEAILAGIASLLDGTGVAIGTIYGGPQSGTHRDGGARRRSPRRLLPTLSSIRELRRLDGLLLAGGGLFNDHWRGVIPRYLAWIVAARVAGVPVVWLGVGVGPIRRRPWRVLARVAARLSRLVLVRDGASAKLLGGVSDHVRVIPDPAVFLARPPRRERGQDRVAIVVRPSLGGRHDARIIESLGGLVDRLTADGKRVELLGFAPDIDGPILARLADGRALERVELNGDPASALARLTEYQAIVSLRLHGLLLAALAGVACLPVAYDDKVSHLAEQLDLGDVVVPVEEVTAVDLALRLERVLDPARVARVENALDALRARRTDVRQMIEEAL